MLVSYSYAITVWYFDAKERAEAKEKYRLGEVLLKFPNLCMCWIRPGHIFAT